MKADSIRVLHTNLKREKYMTLRSYTILQRFRYLFASSFRRHGNSVLQLENAGGFIPSKRACIIIEMNVEVSLQEAQQESTEVWTIV